MNNLLIYLNSDKDRIIETLARLKDIEEKLNINFYILPQQNSFKKYFPVAHYTKKIDAILVFGGDGTILQAAGSALEYKVPILGINLGHLGFLSEISLDELEKSICDLIAKKYKILSRMMLKVMLKSNNDTLKTALALNDVVISKGDKPKLINLKVYCDRRYVFSTRCDGIIAASPTGSTAYSLSAGGPIISPVMDAIVVVPITPHVLTVRPIVFPADTTITFKIEEEAEQSWLQLDGKNFASLNPGDKVSITSAARKVDFIKLSNRTFFKTLRNKMHLGRK
jgi:NAD+ kinase